VTTYYVHLEDPGFPEHPWPGERRLGPFLSSDEALTQAVSDASLGHGVAAGIYAESESEKRLSGRAGKAKVARAEIRRRAETISRKRQDEEKRAAEQVRADIEAILPAGVGWEDLQVIAREMQSRIAAGQSYAPQVHPEPVE
jgi:hypothetical protein